MQIIFLALMSNNKLRCSTILSEKVQKVVAIGYLNLEIIAEDYVKTTLVN
jgi:hypothetical protein